VNAFRFVAYVLPLAAGFALPAALALTRGLPPARRAARAGAVHGALLLVLLAFSFAERVGLFPPAAVLATAFGLFVAAVHLAFELAGAPREVPQLAASLLAALLMGSVFLVEPVLENATRAGLPSEAVGARITLVLSVNPFMTLGLSAFGHDLLHTPTFYQLDLAAYPHAAPRWGATSLGYLLAAALAGAVGAGAAFLRRRGTA
jgi:hypothetical protein